MKKWLPILSAFTAGLYLAACQVGYFLHLEFNLSSTFVAYYVTLGLWFLGGILGLLIRRRGLGLPMLVAGLAAYYVQGLVLLRFPYDMRWLPLYWGLILLTALYSGYFFQQARAGFDSAKALFFHENNGFLVGYVIAAVALLLNGQMTQQVLPLLMAGSHLLVLFCLAKTAARPGSESAST